MQRKVQLLLVTHCLALTAAYGFARKAAGKPFLANEWSAPAKTRSHIRDSFDSSGRGRQLLEDFLMATKEIEPDFDSKYAKLKTSLPVAADVKAAALGAIRELDRPKFRRSTEQENWDQLATAEVRALHWMRRDPVAAMDFLTTDDISFRHSLAMDFNRHVFKDILAEQGLVASVPWLSKSVWTNTTFCDATMADMKAGGGIALLEKLQSTMMKDPGQAAYLAKISEPRNIHARWGEPFFLQAAKAIRFEERDQLLEMASNQPRESDQVDLLRGFARSGPDAAAWLLEAAGRGELQGTVAEQVKTEAAATLRESHSGDLEQRAAALADTPEYARKSPGEVATELIEKDITALFKNGRDWRYEFRHGVATAEEVLATVRHAIPGTSREMEMATREALYRQLVEENPRDARALIEGLPEERKRALEFKVLSGGFTNVSPAIFASYAAGLPPPATPEENRLWREGHLAKASSYSSRFGDAYQEAVTASPEGSARSAAVEGILLETRRKNSAEASKLEKQLSPPTP